MKAGIKIDVMRALVKHGEMDQPLGLSNLGNTCFLNSIIQAVSSCPPFVSYLHKIKESALKFKQESLFAPSLLKCVVDVRSRKTGCVNASEVLRLLTSKNDAFSGYDQQDAEELFQSIVSILNNEAKLSHSAGKGSRVSGLAGILGASAIPVDSGVPQFKCPLEGVLGSQLECEQCKSVRPMRHQPFIDLSLPIPIMKTDRSNAFGNPSSLRGGSDTSESINTGSILNSPLSMENGINVTDCINEFLRGEQLADVECPACTAASTRARISDKVGRMEKIRNLPTAMAEELASSKNVLEHLQQCVTLGPGDSLVLDIDDNSAKANPSSMAVQFHLSKMFRQPAPVTASIDAHMIERIRTPVRKSLFITRLPKLLCFHMQRRVFNPISGRMSKVSQHVNFGTQLDMSSYFYINSMPAMQSVSSLSSVASRCSDSFGCQLSLKQPDNAILATKTAISNQSTSVESSPVTTHSETSCGPSTVDISLCDSIANGLSIQSPQHPYMYDLCAVIVHSGSADGGHYTSICKVADKWFHISDEAVHQVSLDKLLASQAYMLFYSLRAAM